MSDTPIPALESNLKDANWLARLSKPQRKLLEWLVLVLAFGFVMCELYVTRRNVLAGVLAANAPISFEGPWRPDKQHYAPGEVVRFAYTRTTEFDSKIDGPLLAFSVDSFENKTNGEIFHGFLIGRVIDKPGKVIRTCVTRIPNECSSGEYVFEGWIRAETPKRSLPVAFRSEHFMVTTPNVR